MSVTTEATRSSVRPEDENLGIKKSFGYGLQHVLTMYGGIIAPPLIIGGAAGVSTDQQAVLIACCLFIGGLATILQSFGIRFFGSQLPLVQGTSFASVATMTAIVSGPGGIQAVFGAVMASAAIGFLIAPFFSRIVRFFPPVVTGVVIAAIGLSLFPVAGGWIMGNNSEAPEYASLGNIGLGFATLLIILLLSKLGNAAISRLSILLGIVLGTALGALTGQADFSKILDGPYFELPRPFAFGPPVFEIASIVSMTIVVLVILTETTADIIAVGEIVDTEVDSKRIANGLRADMAASFVSPVFNSFTQSAFAQNVGLVAITGVTSRFVVTAGGGILVILGLLPVLGRLVAAIPSPVLGGAGIVLFGTVAVSGIRTLGKVNYQGTSNMIIVAASLGAGMLPVVKPDIYDAFPSWFQTIFHSGISSAAVVAVLLNLLFNELKAGNPPAGEGSVFARAPIRGVSYESLEHLNRQLKEGDYVSGGKLVDCNGQEVPVITAEGEIVDVPICEVDLETEEPLEPLPVENAPASSPSSPPSSTRSSNH
ncbi:uracil permease [Brachybacterium vulturis]|uniref:Uracil permease n=1 Tax=Brachybacterium vulturis TaxID=2017484 RepID=A0A291GQI9_9MICO|nr:nucleobase:cation symporter-2 family protein [Brachybacterium vulturis]ATG52743.1 uracil permease [Brachybacterium vulturis]